MAIAKKTTKQYPYAAKNEFEAHLLTKLKCVRHLNEKNLSSEIKKIAADSNCKYLFDLPRHLLDKKNGSVAALLSFGSCDPELYFIAISKGPNSMRLFEQATAPNKLVNFAWSFAEVMSLVGTLEIKK